MNVEEVVVENLRGLPIDKQQEVLDFVQFLRQRSAESRPQVTLRGLWNGVHITEDDIDEARQEMWGTVQGNRL